MKTINLISLNPIIGGQEVYLINIIKYLQFNYKIQVFTQVSSWENTELFDIKNVNIIDIKTTSYKTFLTIKNIILSQTSTSDIFIFNGNRAIYLGGLFSNNYKKFAIQHSSLYDIQDGVLKKMIRVSLYKLLLFRYKKIIGISKHSIKPILNNTKTEVILNGIDTTKFHIENRLFDSQKNILMVGVLNDNKGQYDALSILNFLDDSYKLVLVGEGEDKGKLEEYISQNSLENRAILVGKTDDVVRYYNSACVLLFLSKNEGLPLTIIEAMACKLPIITTNVGGISEIIEDNVNGIFIDRNDKRDIASKIMTLCEDKNLKEKLINNACSLVQDKLTLQVHVDKLKNIIERV